MREKIAFINSNKRYAFLRVTKFFLLVISNGMEKIIKELIIN